MAANDFSEQVFSIAKGIESYTIAQELDQKFHQANFLLDKVIKAIFELNISIEDSCYLGVLNDLLLDTKALFQILYVKEKTHNSKLTSTIYEVNPSCSRSAYYYVLCEKVCQVGATIGMLIDSSFMEQSSQEFIHMLKAAKNEFIRVNELLELSIIKLPGFYLDNYYGEKREDCPL